MCNFAYENKTESRQFKYNNKYSHLAEYYSSIAITFHFVFLTRSYSITLQKRTAYEEARIKDLPGYAVYCWLNLCYGHC